MILYKTESEKIKDFANVGNFHSMIMAYKSL